MKTLFRIFKWLLAIIVVLIIALLILVNVVDPNQYKDTLQKQASALAQREVEIAGDLDWQFYPWLALTLNDLTVGNPEGYPADKPLLKAGLAEASVRLLPLFKKQLQIGDLTLRDANLNLITKSGGRSNLDGLFGEAPPEAGQADQPDSSLRTGKIDLQNITLNLIEGRSTQQYNISKLGLERFAFDQPLALRLQGAIRENRSSVLEDIDLRGSANVAADMRSISIQGLNLSAVLAANQQALELTGDLALTLEPSINATLHDGRLNIQGQAFDITAEIAPAQTTRVNFSLSGETLDLDQLMGSAAAGSESSESISLGDDLAFLREMTLNGKLKLNQFSSGATQIKNLSADLRGRRGQLSIHNIQGQSFGGNISGKVDIDARKSALRVALQPRIRQADLGQISSAFLGKKMLSANGDLNLDLNLSGHDMEGLLGSLNGQGNYSLGNGNLHGIDINSLVKAILEVRDLSGLSSFNGVFNGDTGFQVMNGSIRAEQGRLQLPDLSVLADQFELGGDGNVDIAQAGVDYTVTLALKGLLHEQLQARWPQIADGRLPITVSGNLSAPKIGLDYEKLMKNMVDARINQQTAEIKQEVEDKKEELKGRLFDRLLKRDEQPEPDETEPETEPETEDG